MINDDPSGELLRAAARNNALWCDAVCRTHGLRPSFSAEAWTSSARTPPLYPDAVTLAPTSTVEAVRAGIDTAVPGCSVKDSFAALDLAPAGFEVLFEASWIHRARGSALPAPGRRLEWSEVATAGELDAWEAAWSGEGAGGLFRPALLDQDLVFLAGRAAGRVVAGAVASAGGGVVGVSNLFAADDADTDETWAAVLAAADARWPALPVVGYEAGDDLAAALRAGFAPLGRLRVWLHTA
ncbi:hypothetical protein [Streptomyces sp. NPDC048606]|uniref:hypothetical protein n=1 Tax=Streptomyces sp. NPDC048606 TaxID=3154726 RepID=UPI003435B671